MLRARQIVVDEARRRERAEARRSELADKAAEDAKRDAERAARAASAPASGASQAARGRLVPVGRARTPAVGGVGLGGDAGLGRRRPLACAGAGPRPRQPCAEVGERTGERRGAQPGGLRGEAASRRGAPRRSGDAIDSPDVDQESGLAAARAERRCVGAASAAKP